MMRLPDPRSQQRLFLQELLGTRLAFGFNSPASFLAPFAITGARAGPKAVQGTVSALWKLAADGAQEHGVPVGTPIGAEVSNY